MKRIIKDDPVRVAKWACEKTGGAYSSYLFWAIGMEVDGKLVAAVYYDNYFVNSIFAHVVIEDKTCLTRDAIRAVFDYPFNQLKVNTVIGLVDSANTAAIKFDEHLGFKFLAKIPEAHRNGDLLLYSMNKSECRWIK